jgi:Xaa-Pro aminopeptidase
MATPARAQDAPLFTADFTREEFARRRQAVLDAVGREAIVVLQGAPTPGNFERFRQANDFYYLTGLESPNAYLLLNGRSRQATLYLPHRHPRREFMDGKTLSFEDADEVKRLSGIDSVSPAEALTEDLARLTHMGGHALFTPFVPAEGAAATRASGWGAHADQYADPWDGRPARQARFLSLLRERFPAYELKDLSPTLDELRLIKSPAEIALIKRATRLSCLALQEAMRSTVPGLWEYELDGLAKFIYFRNGASGLSYNSLVASGPNAWFPHYSAGQRRMQDGELLLMDFAPEVGYYQSDITRMWPVNGRFTPEQRALYVFYLRTYRAVLAHIKPGKTAAEILKAAVADMDKALAESTFAKPEHEQAARAFVDQQRQSSERFAMLGHWVGMSVHDVGSFRGPLRPGMVFTIEPQFRIPEEKGYIRLEDLIVITETGAEVVSDWLPSDPDAIEALMAEEGLLQRYPRDEPR